MKEHQKSKKQKAYFHLTNSYNLFFLKAFLHPLAGVQSSTLLPTPHNHKLLLRRASLSSPATRPLLRVPRARSCPTSRSMRDHPQRELPSNLLADLIRLQPGAEEGKAQACSRGWQPTGYDTRPYPTLHGTKPNAEMLQVNVGTPVTSVQKRTHSAH